MQQPEKTGMTLGEAGNEFRLLDLDAELVHILGIPRGTLCLLTRGKNRRRHSGLFWSGFVFTGM